MPQIKNGIRSILERPFLYTFFQRMIAPEKNRAILLNDYIQLESGMEVLDLGCGPASILKNITHKIAYHGVDFQNEYIETAKIKYASSRYSSFDFTCADITTFDFSSLKKKYDRILLHAILHHLSDEEVDCLLSQLPALLKEDGFIFNIENTFVEQQCFLERTLVKMDRGQNVRTPEGYLFYFNKYFSQTSYELRRDLLRVPYTHVIIKAKK
jgi:2-polyprenyl-3-methyl-5-hydroxy-6-metoxy-1,4-benzoquinol methylase